MEREQSKLSSAERDSIIFAFSVDKHTPAIIMESIELIINTHFTAIKIYYACLPGEKQNLKESIFTSLKDEFTNPMDKPAAFIAFSIHPGGQMKLSLQKTAKEIGSQSFSLLAAEDKKKLKETILSANQTGKP